MHFFTGNRLKVCVWVTASVVFGVGCSSDPVVSSDILNSVRGSKAAQIFDEREDANVDRRLRKLFASDSFVPLDRMSTYLQRLSDDEFAACAKSGGCADDVGKCFGLVLRSDKDLRTDEPMDFLTIGYLLEVYARLESKGLIEVPPFDRTGGLGGLAVVTIPGVFGLDG
jgi:hypothetical protein